MENRMNTLESYKQTYLDTLSSAQSSLSDNLNCEYIYTDEFDILIEHFTARGYLEAKGINLLELEKGV